MPTISDGLRNSSSDLFRDGRAPKPLPFLRLILLMPSGLSFPPVGSSRRRVSLACRVVACAYDRSGIAAIVVRELCQHARSSTPLLPPCRLAEGSPLQTRGHRTLRSLGMSSQG